MSRSEPRGDGTAHKKSPPNWRASKTLTDAYQSGGHLMELSCAHFHGHHVVSALRRQLFCVGIRRNPESHGYPCFGFSGSVKMLAKIGLLSVNTPHIVCGSISFKSHVTLLSVDVEAGP